MKITARYLKILRQYIYGFTVVVKRTSKVFAK